MTRSRLSQIFVGLASKRLTKHQLKPTSSNGHEFQGSQSLLALLGREEFRERPCIYFWLPRNEEDELLRLESTVSWYDSRRNDATRAPEWRLYYPSAADGIVRGKADVGDLAVVGLGSDGMLYVFLAAAGSSWERKLTVLLSLPTDEGKLFSLSEMDEATEVGLAEELFLDTLGFEVPLPVDTRAEDEVTKIYERFNGILPTTEEFSNLARKSFKGPAIEEDPDATLVGWMEWETLLFRLFEARMLRKVIPLEVMPGGKPDVEAFLKLARSVGNTRFSRAGHAFENHVAAMLSAHCIEFDCQKVTENKNKPDFLFPKIGFYHDPCFDKCQLRMLAVKTSCKDRWRQILAEADRIERKHLLTLETPLSLAQTDEMGSRNVALVIPAGNHIQFTPSQRGNLMSVRDFLDEMKCIQKPLFDKGLLPITPPVKAKIPSKRKATGV